MDKEEEIRQGLIENFNIAEEKAWVPKLKRVFVEANIEDFKKVLEYLMKDNNFDTLCTITGLDYGESIGMIYHLTRQDGIVVNLKTSVPKENPVIQSIINYFPAAELYEREVVDLLGARVEGLPEGSRYPLPDGWPEGQYPLRKDWKSETSQKEGK
jgi:Ni,Fe-hydrogenase III component G